MNNNNYAWIMFHKSYLTDADFMQLSKSIRWDYIHLTCMAREADAEGLLAQNNKPLTQKHLCYLLQSTPEEVQELIDGLVAANLLSVENDGFVLTNFFDEQSVQGDTDTIYKIKEDNRKRQQKHRNKIKKEKEINPKENINTNINKNIKEDIDINTNIDIKEMRDENVTVTLRNVTSRDSNVTNLEIQDQFYHILTSNKISDLDSWINATGENYIREVIDNMAEEKKIKSLEILDEATRDELPF